MKKRGFELVTEANRKESENAILPQRGSKISAGYDISTPLKVVIPAKSKKMIWSNIKAYMQEEEVLILYVRSSLGIKKGLSLANGTGIIDSDYYNNSSNEGNIGICLVNNTDDDIILEEAERIAQVIFMPFLISDNGDSDQTRIGGFGSTGTK